MDTKARFLAKVRFCDDGCHEWVSTLHRDGYGKFWLNGGMVQAHRVAYMLYVGEVPANEWVLHKCDNRKCVNPSHLYLGTPKQNTADKIKRCAWHGNMQVPFALVEKSRELYAQGMTQQSIADLLGLKQAQVSKYVLKKQRIHK